MLHLRPQAKHTLLTQALPNRTKRSPNRQTHVAHFSVGGCCRQEKSLNCGMTFGESRAEQKQSEAQGTLTGIYLIHVVVVNSYKIMTNQTRIRRGAKCGLNNETSGLPITFFQEYLEELDLEYISALTDAGLCGKAIEREPQGEQYVLNPTGYSISNLKSKYLRYFYISAAQAGFGPQSV